MTYVDPQIPPTERVVEIRREGNTTGWIVAGIVAVVAVIAVAFMLNQRPADTTQDQLLQAQEQGRAAGVIEGAQSSVATSAPLHPRKRWPTYSDRLTGLAPGRIWAIVTPARKSVSVSQRRSSTTAR